MNIAYLVIIVYCVIGYIVGLVALKTYSERKKVDQFDVILLPIFMMLVWPIALVIGVMDRASKSIVNKLNKEG